MTLTLSGHYFRRRCATKKQRFSSTSDARFFLSLAFCFWLSSLTFGSDPLDTILFVIGGQMIESPILTNPPTYGISLGLHFLCDMRRWNPVIQDKLHCAFMSLKGVFTIVDEQFLSLCTFTALTLWLYKNRPIPVQTWTYQMFNYWKKPIFRQAEV